MAPTEVRRKRGPSEEAEALGAATGTATEGLQPT
jgi:hypothetical protein